MDEFLLSLEDIRTMENVSLVEGAAIIGDLEGSHYHWDHETQFYNHCHGKGGKFCPTNSGGGGGGSKGDTGKGVSGKVGHPGREKSHGIKETAKKTVKEAVKNLPNDIADSIAESITGRTSLPDSDGKAIAHEGTITRGKHGASLVDPSVGTKTIAGVKGYDKSGKPVAGTDAWLEAHGITREVFANRPYVKYEAKKDDAALIEAYKDFPKAQKFFLQRAEQEGQTGGYLMYKHEVPGSPWGHIAPQARPNAPIITDMAKHSYAKKVLDNDIERLATIKKTTPTALRTERKTQLKQSETNLSRIKSASPEKIRSEAEKNLAKAQSALDSAKKSGDPTRILDAKHNFVSEKRVYIKDIKRANNWNPEKELYDAELSVKYAKARLEKSLTDPKGALADEIKSQERRVERSDNRFKKTAAKYVFPPGTSSARIDMNPDPQNVKNLKEGKGRIYFAMEGSIKADAILTSIKKEDPTATVVNVPSVTLWQQKTGLTGGQAGGIASGEVKWFAGKYGKGREIVLIPDADGITNPNVMMQAKALSTSLRSSGVGRVILAAPPLKAGTKKVVDHFNLPSGVDEGRKGIDDHLGGGRGELGQLQYTHVTKVPKYDLSEFTGVKKGEGPKINRNSIKNSEAALAAISGIAGPGGVTRMPKKMLAQTANLPLTSAKEARDRLEKLGIIKVEHIFDEQALSRGKRIRNPKVSDDRVKELVKQGVIKEPRLDQPFTEVTIEESPVISILDKRFIISAENVHTGILQDIPTWSPPKSHKGWVSPITSKPDSTGIAAKLRENAVKSTAKKEASRPKFKKAPPGRRIVRSQAGAKKYGVSIGDLIPIQEAAGETDSVSILNSVLTSLVLIPGDIVTEEDLIEFYNHCHGKGGKFCPTSSGGSGGGVSGKASMDKASWPSTKGRNITTVAKADRGSVKVDGIKAKAVYEVTASNGNKIRLYDKTGEAGKYYKDLLNNHARMNEMYPLKPARNIVVTKPGKGLEKRDFSSVNSNRNETYVNGGLLGFNIKAIRKGYLMPSSHTGNTKNMDYLLTHEYGHQVDFSKHVSGDNHKAHPLYSDPAFKNALSTYGKKSPVEAYAEAFAEWHYSRGRTTNPAAISMARYEGWHGATITASAVLQSEDLISMINYGLVHCSEENGYPERNLLSFEGFEFQSEGDMFPDDTDEDIFADIKDEGGVTALDDFDGDPTFTGKEKDPSADSVAKATKLVKDVFGELGLDYDAYSKGEVG